jgi:hypothetical protein
MKSKLEALADYLAGGRGADADRVRRELADPAGEAGRLLTATRTLSRDLLAPHTLGRLGLPPDLPGESVARAAWRHFVRVVPWCLAGVAGLLGCLLWLHRACDCGHREVEPGPAPAAVASTSANEGKVGAGEVQGNEAPVRPVTVPPALAGRPDAGEAPPRGQEGPLQDDCQRGLLKAREELDRARGELAAARTELAGKAVLEEKLRAAEVAREALAQQLSEARAGLAEAQEALRKTRPAPAERKDSPSELQVALAEKAALEDKLRRAEGHWREQVALLDQARAALAQAEARREAARQELVAYQETSRRVEKALRDTLAAFEEKLRAAEARRMQLEAALDKVAPRPPGRPPSGMSPRFPGGAR